MAMPAEAIPIPGLRYVTDASPGIRRKRAGKGFSYVGTDGKRISDKAELERIRKLAIPPAWTDVWICPSPNGHILATGRDAKGRKQYRYHPKWRKVRDEAKFERTVSFGEALPALRRKVKKDMALTGLPKERVVATVVALLDCCFARVGNEEYVKENGSFGLTTLRARHAKIKGSTMALRFRGKAGKEHEVEVSDPRIVHIVRRCREIEGQELFQYLDDGNGCPITSGDVNTYLREVTGQEYSAKDFRTWAGTVTACAELASQEPVESDAENQRTVLAAIDEVAEALGNTRTVCRNCYIHPDVIEGFLDGGLHKARQGSPSTSAERFTLSFLRTRARSRRRVKAA
jgi:DNA topoisomerase-1